MFVTVYFFLATPPTMGDITATIKAFLDSNTWLNLLLMAFSTVATSLVVIHKRLVFVIFLSF